MAFKADGWRKLVIGTAVYYWQAERWSDGCLVRPEREPHRLLRVREAGCAGMPRQYVLFTPGLVRAAVECAVGIGWPDARPTARLGVFINPVRFAVPHPRWLTEPVVALAQGISAEEAFDRMPILADALEEAACDDTDILNHCRGEGPHHRGCWVLELLMWKG
jgi:hypothetical protein